MKYFLSLLTMLLALASGLACRTLDGETQGKAETGATPFLSYGELERTEETVVIEDGVRIVLYENQALPYRWKLYLDSNILCLDSDETVDGEGVPFVAGDSPAYHVFTLRFTQDGSAGIRVKCVRIEPMDESEIMEERSYLLEKNGESITVGQ